MTKVKSLPNLIGIIGQFGSGKSLYMLELGLELANRYKKKLIVNFKVKDSAVKSYCRAAQLKWFAVNGRLIYFDLANRDLSELLISDSVILFDEVGFYLNARNWRSLSPEFSRKLFQLRHYNIHLIMAFQFYAQVDKNLRECCQHWILCSSISRYSESLQMPRMFVRYAMHFDSEKFNLILEDTKFRSNFLRKWISALAVRWSILFLNEFVAEIKTLTSVLRFYLSKMRKKFVQYYSLEQLLFKCYDSAEKIGEVPFLTNKIVYVSDGLDAPLSVRNRKSGKSTKKVDSSWLRDISYR